jgi:two-component system sensor histidine kinase KdpD
LRPARTDGRQTATPMPSVVKFDRVRQELRGLFFTFLLVLAATALIEAIILEVGLTRGTVIYLIPVVIAAIRWGIVSAIFASITGVMGSAFFFFPPLYSLRIRDPQEIINLLLYLFAAIVVSQLANRLRHQLDVSRRREIDLRDLYAFSRRLAGAFKVTDIHSAIEDHLATVLQRKVILFASAEEASNVSSARRTGGMVPEKVLAAVVETASGRRIAPSGTTVTADGGEVWLVRAVSPANSALGVTAIDLGRESEEGLRALRAHLDAVLADATATLERLDVAHAIDEARMRAHTDQLREALIESVSHELRTPLASILGAATVLSAAPALQGEPKLQALAQDVRDEAERLNNDIQNLLDASRISTEGVRPRTEWADPSDIVNSAIERCRRRLANRKLKVDLATDLPLIHVDPVLVQQALVQLFDNAVKYSQPGSQVTLAASVHNGMLTIGVGDEGTGLTRAEQAQMWGRFVRGERHAAATSGSGLGLWIANAFVAANGGSMSAVSAGPGKGAVVRIELPVTQAAVPQLEGDEDE